MLKKKKKKVIEKKQVKSAPPVKAPPIPLKKKKKEVVPEKSVKTGKSSKAEKPVKQGSSSSKKARSPGGFFKNEYGGLHAEAITTSLCRVAFVNLVSPSTKYKPPKYGAHLLFDKKDPKYLAFVKKLKVVGKALYADQFGGKKVSLEQPLIRDGDKHEWNGFKGRDYLPARNKKQPTFTAVDKSLGIDSVEAGMICRCVISPGINDDGFFYRLDSIKLVEDDEVRWGGAVDGVGLLDAIDEETGADSDEDEDEDSNEDEETSDDSEEEEDDDSEESEDEDDSDEEEEESEEEEDASDDSDDEEEESEEEDEDDDLF